MKYILFIRDRESGNMHSLEFNAQEAAIEMYEDLGSSCLSDNSPMFLLWVYEKGEENEIHPGYTCTQEGNEDKPWVLTRNE